MNNFEQFRRATILSDTHSSYQLAKMLVEAEEELKLLREMYEKNVEKNG